jgi:uncharacterized protein (DUF2062 family)
MELIPSPKIYPKPTCDWRAADRFDTMSKWLTTAKTQTAGWLRMGVSPRRLALTLALGFAIGCLPVFVIPTAVCAVVAVTFGLNVPAIQAANYAAMPLQLALVLPLVRLGKWMFPSGSRQALKKTLAHGAPIQVLQTSGHALAAWLVVAVPMVLLLTLVLTPLLQRVPALAEGAD